MFIINIINIKILNLIYKMKVTEYYNVIGN